jgi:ketosteroid isomerase-like protein
MTNSSDGGTVSDSTHDRDVLNVVDRFCAALGEGDIQQAADLFTDDAVVWHNYDQVEQPPVEALAPAAALAPLRPVFDIVRRYVVDDGCIQQHVIRLTTPTGTKIAIPVVQRICVDGGKITRIDEYMDTAPLAALAGSPA